MKKRLEKYFLTSTIVLLVSCAYLWMSNIVNKSVLTDSGFDYSYDSSKNTSSRSSYKDSSYERKKEVVNQI